MTRDNSSLADNGFEAEQEAALGLLRRQHELNDAGRPDEALRLEDEFLARFRESSDEIVQGYTAGVLYARTRSLGDLGRWGDALAACDALLEWCAAGKGNPDHESAGLYVRGRTLDRLGRTDEALTVYDALARRFGEQQTDYTRRIVACGLYAIGYDLNALGQYEEAAVAFAAVGERCRGDSELVDIVARALERQVDALVSAGTTAAAVDACDAFLERFSGTEDHAVKVRVVRVLSVRAGLLAVAGHEEEALVDADAALARVAAGIDGDLRLPRARALLMKGLALVQEDRWEEALDVFAEVVAEYRDADSPELQRQAALGLNNKVACLVELGRADDARDAQQDLATNLKDAAMGAFDETFQTHADANDERVRALAARALLGKAAVLAQSEQPNDAAAVLNVLIEKYGNDDSPELMQALAGARQLQEDLLAEAEAEAETEDEN